MAQRFQWKEISVGTCYYPEHWPESMWREDLTRMLENGIRTIRIGEFAWSKFEETEGNFDFSFFDRFLALCRETGMRVIFGTPTATPPAWLTEAHPEVLNADINGILFRHGGRRHYNYNSPVYQEYCRKIVEQLAVHYGDHPAIVGWQIDNELNCEKDEFYSEADAAAFRDFLREKYGTLEALNEAWGTVFWNQTYTDWAQVTLPRPAAVQGVNPHLLLDYSRFVSHSAIRFAKLQADILRKHIRPGVFITTNGMFGNLDNPRLAEECLDVYTYDSYPNFAYELNRRNDGGLKDRKWSRHLTEVRSVCSHFGIMEQQSGAGGWYSRMESPMPRPGQLSLWATQSLAHGADYISFFRWRTCTFGTEMYWHGILDYDSRENRRLREVREFAKRAEALQEICGADFRAAFAVLTDIDNELDARVDQWHQRVIRPSMEGIDAGAQKSHTPYDLAALRPKTIVEDLEKYPLLIAPHPVIVTPERVALLKEYVSRGGMLIIGCRAGYKDLCGRCVTEPMPGLLRELTGTTVEDYTFASPGEEPIWMAWGEEKVAAPVFNDVLACEGGAKPLALYGNGYFAGQPALTENRIGRGRVLHFGSTFEEKNTQALLRYGGVMDPYAVEMGIPEDVELVPREKDGRLYIFLLNYQPEERAVRLNRSWTILPEGKEIQGEFLLPPYGTAVLKKQ